MNVYLDVLMVVGLIGFSVSISRGDVMERFARWTQGFEHPLNPLPLLGWMLHCPVTVGAIIGAGWMLVTGHRVELGGVVAIGTMFVAMLIDKRQASDDRKMESLVAFLQAKKRARREKDRGLVPSLPSDPTRDDVDKYMDDMDRVEDEQRPAP